MTLKRGRRVAGIDPGQTGAVVVYEDGEVIAILDMPMVQTKGKLKYVNGKVLREFLVGHEVDEIIVEQVASRPGQGVRSVFNFGMGFGAVLAVAMTVPVPLTLVAPQVWKRRAGLLKTGKDEARCKVLTMFPKSRASFQRKKDIGRADALLIATYGVPAVV